MDLKGKCALSSCQNTVIFKISKLRVLKKDYHFCSVACANKAETMITQEYLSFMDLMKRLGWQPREKPRMAEFRCLKTPRRS